MRFEYLEAVYDRAALELIATAMREDAQKNDATAAFAPAPIELAGWLNDYGADRWELLHVLTGDFQTLRCVFKRPRVVTRAERAAATRATKAAARATREERIASRRQRLVAKSPTRKR